MKRIFALMLCLMLAPVLLSGEDAGIRGFQSVAIYNDARPDLMGRAVDRSRVIEVPLSRFRTSETRTLSRPVETALIVKDEIVDFLTALSETADRKSDLAAEITVDQIAPLTFQIGFPDWGIENIYRFSPPDGKTLSVIRDYYSNSYWEEVVEAEYRDNYTVTVLAAEDVLPPYGESDYYEALLAATIIAAKSQPLWGIHDGLGLLDGLGYALVEAENRKTEERGEYRKYTSNSREMQDLVLRIRQADGDLAETIHSTINSMVQFEKDDRFLLPEELMEAGEGDCLEFALAYYDMLKRCGYTARILAMRLDGDPPEDFCPYITVYQKEEFAPWGYIWFKGYGDPVNKTWEEIPAMVLRNKVFFYPLNADILIRTGKPDLPPFQAWSISIY